ncbi:MAG: AAA family ATPase [Desulfarculus sp.]|nr:AAA family ATPase [Desulfarculus sp.]
MDWKFLQTQNVRNLVGAMSGLMNRPAGVPCLAVVHGPAGRGKTEAASWYAVNKGGRYLVANSMWSERWMLSDLYAALRGLKSAHFGLKKQAYEECLKVMHGDSLPIFIDEADRVAQKTNHLEALRDLSDRSGVPIVFVGTDQILYRLQQREQFASRVSQVVAFKALGRDEVKMIVGELTGLGLDDEVADKLVTASDGYFRDLVVLLSHLSRAAKASGAKALNQEMVTQVAKKAVLRMAA